jgi:hypothetical protein
VIRKQQDSKETLFSCKNVTITPFSWPKSYEFTAQP